MNKTDPRWMYARSLWARRVRELFSFTCLLCGRKQGFGELFHAHHIIPCRFRHSELLVANGALLCTPHGDSAGCHGELHGDEGVKVSLDALIMLRFPQWWELLNVYKKQNQGGGLGVYTKAQLESDIEQLESMGIE